MTVQALRVLVTSRYADAGRIGRRLHVLHVNARDALDLVFHWAVDGVVGMTCITGHVRGNPVVLKVLRWNECRIVYVEASTVRHHDVHEVQNFVCSERCMWMFMPPTMHSAGSTQSPMKATIFQLALLVTEGRIKKMEASPRLRTI